MQAKAVLEEQRVDQRIDGQRVEEQRVDGQAGQARQLAGCIRLLEDLLGVPGSDILAGYRKDIIGEVTDFILKSGTKKTFQEIERFQNFRMLAELIESDLSDYEQMFCRVNRIPDCVMVRYTRIMDMIDGGTHAHKECTVIESIHLLAVLVSDEYLQDLFFLRETRRITRKIVKGLKAWEQRMCAAAAGGDNASDSAGDGATVSRAKGNVPPLTLKEYRERYEERRSMGCWWRAEE